MREIRPPGLMSGVWKRGTVRLVRHRQTKGPVTDRPSLKHRATPRLYVRVPRVLPSGCNSPPGNWVAPASSYRSGGGRDETVEAFEKRYRPGDTASRQAVTRVNVDRASKRPMWTPTRPLSGQPAAARDKGQAEIGRTTSDQAPPWATHCVKLQLLRHVVLSLPTNMPPPSPWKASHHAQQPRPAGNCS